MIRWHCEQSSPRMTEAATSGTEAARRRDGRRRLLVVSALGLAMIMAWGSSFYLLAVLANPIAADTGWPLSWIVGAMSIGFLVSGLVSPRVGRAIERRGGRPVLAFGAVFMALGLFGLALAPTLPLYVLAWVVLGIGMGAGLYDPAMAALGRLYGADARRSITALTLFGGLASTVCWPLSAYLVEAVGWRGTCAAYALIHLFVSLPLYLFALPREPKQAPAPSRRAPAGAAAAAPARRPERRRILLLLVALALTLSSGITSAIGVHLLTLLQAQGIAFAAAVALGTIIGPSQVGARLLEMLLGTRFHPVWTMIASAALVVGGLALLFGNPYWVAVGLVVYGAGNGLTSIVRGTLPLALFGAEGYATLMGLLGRPLLIAFAVTPSLGAVVLDRYGAGATVAMLVGIAAVNLVAALVLAILVRRGGKGTAAA
jgi:predicted MFS family arabinose efflux permease